MKSYSHKFIFSLVKISFLSSVSFSLDAQPSHQEALSLPLLQAYDRLPLEIWSNIISWIPASTISSIPARPRFYVALSILSHRMNYVAKNLLRETSYVFPIRNFKSCAQYLETLHQKQGWYFPNVNVDLVYRDKDFKPNLFLGPFLLFNSTTLKSLDLWCNEMNNEGAKALSMALKNNATLTSLNLSYNKIGSKGVVALSAALKNNTTLASLDLNRNQIGNKGAVALSTTLQNNSMLTFLDLWGNKISKTGARALSAALLHNATLKSLDVGGNKMNKAGAAALATALQINATLTSFDLSFDSIGNEGAAALATAIQINTTLTSLNLSYNNIGKVGVCTLSAALQNNTTLKSLNLWCPETPREGEIKDVRIYW